MLRVGRYVFRRAESADEFEQIHRLNYRTFVEEIPQHEVSATGRLVDKFHAKNLYFIALFNGHLVGMIAAHDQPPFSVALRLPDPSILERAGSRPIEIRLLAIEPEHRSGHVLMGLMWLVCQHARDHGYTDVYISGVAHRVEMYERIGFRPLGPPVGQGDASFVPMGVTFPLDSRVEALIQLWIRRLTRLSERQSS